MYNLEPHQREAVEWLKAVMGPKPAGSGLIYGDVGIGKTVITVAFVAETLPGRVLVLTTASDKDKWRSEIRKFTPELAGRYMIENYEAANSYDRMREMAAFDPDLMVCDEAEKLKNPTAKSVKKLKTHLKPRGRIALSATPTPNAAWEFWSIIDWLLPGFLGRNFFEFRLRECIMNPYIKGKIIKLRDEDAFLRKIDPFVKRIDGSVLDLPPVESSIVTVPLSSEERLEYKRIRDEGWVRMKDGMALVVPNLMVELGRLLQFVNDPQVFDWQGPESKREALLELLAASSEKTIVFSEFATLCDRMAASRPQDALIVGRLGEKARVEQLARFKDDPDCRVLWSSSAGALGLNLQHATRVIHYNLPYTNARLKQRLGRAHRYGQEKTVTEVVMLAEDTVEQRVWKIVERKRKLGEKLTRQDYKEMLELI